MGKQALFIVGGCILLSTCILGKPDPAVGIGPYIFLSLILFFVLGLPIMGAIWLFGGLEKIFNAAEKISESHDQKPPQGTKTEG